MRAIALHHEIDRQAQLAAADAHVRTAVCALDNFRIVGDDGDVIAATHELLGFARAAVGLLSEDLHHVLLGVGELVRAAVPVGWDVERLVIVQQFEHVRRWRRVDHRRRDELVHGFVVRRL